MDGDEGLYFRLLCAAIQRKSEALENDGDRDYPC